MITHALDHVPPIHPASCAAREARVAHIPSLAGVFAGAPPEVRQLAFGTPHDRASQMVTAPPRDLVSHSHNLFVTSFIGNPCIPAVLPAVGPMDYPVPGYSARPFVSTGLPHLQENAPSLEPTVGMCSPLGPYRRPMPRVIRNTVWPGVYLDFQLVIGRWPLRPRYSSQSKNHCSAEMCSGFEESSYSRLADCCITQLQARE